MKRFFLTLTVTATLWGAYRLYAQFLGPLTATTAAPPPAEISAPGAPVQPLEFAQASRSLPQAEWTKTATFRVKHADDAFLYFNRYEPRPGPNGAGLVDVEPFALVWHNPEHPGDAPYIFLCESARVAFEREFKVGGPSPGRMIAGRLDGQVRIEGPNGLVIDGRNCVFDEATHQLYSDEALTFSYKPRSGEVSLVQGEGYQLQIDLIPSTYAELGRDMPRVSRVDSIVLRRNVRLDFTYLEEGIERKTRVTCAGQFKYDVTKKVASFDDRVRVMRPTHKPGEPEQLDTLTCQWLALQFEETGGQVGDPSAVTDGSVQGIRAAIGGTDGLTTGPAEGEETSQSSSPFGRLRFRLLRAIGDAEQPVVVTSQGAGFTGRMLDLGYDAVARAMAMLDTQSREGVVLTHAGSTLYCPTIRVTHDEHQELTSAQCLQPGRLEHTHVEQPGEPPLFFKALWRKQLWFEPRPQTNETIVSLEGEAAVIQPGEYGILCDKLTLWLDSARMDSLPGTRASVAKPKILAISGAAPTADPAATRDRTIPLKRALAEGNVAMAGRQFQVETARLDVAFENGTLAATSPKTSNTSPASGGGAASPVQPAANPPAGAGASPKSGPGASSATPREDLDEQSWVVKASSIDARVLQDPAAGGRAEVAELVGQGKVAINQAPAEGTARTDLSRSAGSPPEELLSVTGDKLHLLNEGGIDQTLHLTGAPAHLRRGEVHIEGDELLFDRALNTATVVGKGMMQVPVDQSVTGEALAEPSLLDIYWTRQMTFDGALAKFTEGVRSRLEDSVMRCDEMTVLLNRRVDFTESRPNTKGLSIQTVRCLNGVDVEFYSWEEQGLTGGTPELIGVTKGRAAEFRLRYDTGEFEARGPGYFDGWQKAEERRVDIEPDSVARANQPVESSPLGREYSNVHFAGKITGNFQKRQATLHDQVRALYAPVERALQVFVRDDLSRETPSSKNAVWLGCDELQVTLHPRAPGGAARQPKAEKERDYVQLLAVGKLSRVELEGRLFQANADTLSYDESTKLFTLRGLGANKASIAYQERPATQYREANGQTIQFNPARRSVSVQGSDGAFGTN